MSNKDSESSAYWTKVNRQNGIEEVTANPDLLSEFAELFPKTALTSTQEEQYELYLKAIEKVEFSRQQRIMWKLFSIKQCGVTEIAEQLGLNKSTVSRTLKAAIDKIKEICEAEIAKKFSDTRSVYGFNKGITTKGIAETDPLFKERMDQHKDEVEEFYRVHPQLKEGKKKKILESKDKKNED